MTELHDAAYRASAEALKRNMLAYVPEILRLEGPERVCEDETNPYCVRIDPGIGESFPIMNIDMKPWRKRGPGSPTEVMIRSIERLARARLWRRSGTVAPPAGIMVTSAIGKAMLEHHGIEPQAFLDATWRPVAMGDKYADTHDWRDGRSPPDLLARTPLISHAQRDLPDAMPWTAGYSAQDAVFIEAIALSPDVIIYWRPPRNDMCEIRLTPGLPRTTVIALQGQPLRKLVSHPVLNRFELWISTYQFHRRSLRFGISGGGPWRRMQFRGGKDERRLLKEEISALAPSRRHLEKLITGQLTLPGRTGDVEVEWQLTHDGDAEMEDWDYFLNEPIERDEFPSVSSRRADIDLRRMDDDPVITFDGGPDDPTSYPS